MRLYKVIYWHTDTDNYGDLLSPYIIGKLTGAKVIKKNYFVGNLKSHIFNRVKCIKNGDLKFLSPYTFPFEKVILAVGSILSRGNIRSQIWGSGFMRPNDICKGGVVYAVRGYESLSMLRKQKEAGCPIYICKKVAVGDPALLLPLLIVPAKEKIYRTGIIPHFSEYKLFNEKFGNKYRVINLNSSNVEEVTREITRCERIISTSLHGMIVAHAYGIPAIWMDQTGMETEHESSGFKYRDYLSSVEIKAYPPIQLNEESFDSEKDIDILFDKFRMYSLPKKNITEIQQSLLEHCPLKLLDQPTLSIG